MASAEKATQCRWAGCLLLGVIAAYAGWLGIFLMHGPVLAVNHDEVNFVTEALRLPAQGRLHGYGHGPILYELIALAELAWYVVLRATGHIASPTEFVTYVLV